MIVLSMAMTIISEEFSVKLLHLADSSSSG